MPIYEFVCENCGQEFEELLRSTSLIADVSCPKCACPHVKRVLSTFATWAAGGKATAYWCGSPSSSSCSSGGA